MESKVDATKLREVSLPKPVLHALGFSLALWAICLSLMAFWTFYLHLPYPYNFPFFPVQHLYDVLCLAARFQHVHSADFFSPRYGYPYQYPAPAAVFYVMEDLFSRQIRTFFFTAGVGLAIFAWFFAKHLHIAGLKKLQASAVVLFGMLFSYTLWFEGVQANIEIFLAFVVASGAIAFFSKRTFLAAALFGIAGAMKIFPMALLGLFIPLRLWRELGFGLLIAAAATLAGLWLLCPDIRYAAEQVSYGLSLQRDGITLLFDWRAVGFDHSIFAVIKVATYHLFNAQLPVFYPRWMFQTYALIAVLAGLSLWFIQIRRLPLLNQLGSLLLCAVLLPPTSYEYTLLHMYLPCGLLLLYAVEELRAGRDVSGLTPTFLLFAFLFSPTSEIIIRSVNVGGNLKCAALFGLLYRFLTCPLPVSDEPHKHSFTFGNLSVLEQKLGTLRENRQIGTP